ncbi:hypothetical protein AVEN_77830-1 [Araneus ventricosus]|uniref:Uncharacterized protein n=1 Tax=Araneus ventricosus TaxID=182803 RepID=A0A4Y2GN10_ARAVE|nr:hypothetical protein AVEN_77830-1 [Araneus ventricosus]
MVEQLSSLNKSHNKGVNNDEVLSLIIKNRYVRGNILLLCNTYNIDGSQEEIDNTLSRFSETFQVQRGLDNKIHLLLSDEEFELQILECADYEEKGSLTIFNTRKALEKFEAPSAIRTPYVLSSNEAINTLFWTFPSSYASSISPNMPRSYF